MVTSESTVFLVDDDASVLQANSRLLRSVGFRVKAFASAAAFLEEYDPAWRGCLILDVSMPGLGGLDLQEAMAARNVSLPVVFLTGRGDVQTSVLAMKRGAVDFLIKPVGAEVLVSAVRAAIARDHATSLIRAEVSRIRGRLATLTPREYEVLMHVVSGKLNKQTAVELGTAEKTIKVHRARVMEKMLVQSSAELARLVERVGIRAEATAVEMA